MCEHQIDQTEYCMLDTSVVLLLNAHRYILCKMLGMREMIVNVIHTI
jgi:hypothetical protein